MWDCSFGIIEPGEVRLRSDTGALNSSNGAYSPECVEEEFHEVRCYSSISRMPSLIRFNSCALTSPIIVSGEVGSADDRDLPTQSSANLFDFSAPARSSKTLIEVSVLSPLSNV